MDRLKIIGLIFTLYGIVFLPGVIAANGSIIHPEKLTRLLAKAANNGHVGIIIGLKLPHPGFKTEGVLSLQEVKQQKKAISAAQDALISSMSEFDVEVYKIYTSIPYMAIKVNVNALRELASSPQVTSIQEDSALMPHSNDSSIELKENTVFAGETTEAK